MAWLWLIVAGFFEIGWAIGLKYTDGFSKILPSLFTIAMMAVSFFFLSMSLKSIPMGTAYAVWTGIGAIGIAVLGILLFNESPAPSRLICIGLIITGVLGLKYAS